MRIFSDNYNYDIIIIGGGISGLFTGYKLAKSGLKILIIEGSNRLGGRINTIWNENYYYESGAARFHKNHTKLLSLINELELKETIEKLPNKIDYIIENKKIKKLDENYHTLLKEAIENKSKMKKEKLMNITFYQYLILLFDFKRAKLIKECFGYDSEIIHLNAYAALTMFKNDLFEENDYYVLNGGLSQMIERLKDNLDTMDNVIIKKKCILKEVYPKYIITDGGDTFHFQNLIITIPSEKLKEIEYFKGNQLLNSVRPIKLLRIYAQYPTDNLWFKDIKRTITDNYIRHIIPINYEEGIIMISYTDDIYSKMWDSYNAINSTFLIKALHKEISNLFGIIPPKPKMISTHYWENGFHVWKVGYDIHDSYKSIIKPTDDNIYIAGESYSKKQGWIEGSLETCYDVIKQLEIKNIKVITKSSEIVRKEEKELFTIEEVLYKNDVLKKKWIVLNHDGEKPIYDISKWISKHPGGSIILEGIKANRYYKKDKPKEFSKPPYDIFKTIHSEEVLKKYLLKDNQFIKKVGYLKE